MTIRSSDSCRFLALASLCVLAAASGCAYAQEAAITARSGAPKTAPVARVEAAISVDGVFDEPAWQRTATIGALVQQEPQPGEAPTESTDVRLLQDGDYLYVAVICHDSAPAEVIGTQMARDASLDDDDRIELVLDTFQDGRNAFYFAVNPAGALVDGLVIEGGTTNLNWDAIWNARTRRTPEGWTAEFAIPFKSIRFRAGQPGWGFNVSRSIQRKLEEDRWVGGQLDIEFLQVAEAGEITGLEDAAQGIGLDVRPFIALHELDREGEERSETVDPGLDLFYSVTPSLDLSATFNTDFGETEVDARQINLTRFPLFFPEKRTFFLENSANFSFSNTGNARGPGGGNALIPFFSRRIGLVAGEEVPIFAGAQLTGTLERTDLGVLGVRTDDAEVAPAENFFVGRVKQNLLRQSYIGAIYTHGDPSGLVDSSTRGADFRYSTSDFLARERNFSVDVFGLASRNEDISGDDAAYGFSVAYPNDLFDLSLSWREVQENFSPALGFVQRGGVQTTTINADYAPRPRNFVNVRQMFHEFRYNLVERVQDGADESRRLFIAPINWQFNTGDRVEFNWVPQFERLFEPFEISEGVVLQPGDYRFTRWRLEAFSAAKRRFEARATWWLGTYWSGRGDEIELLLQYKAPPRFVINFSTEQTRADLPEGSFVALINTLRVTYAFSPFLALSNLFQYDNVSRNLGWQARVRWTLRPGNDLFFVLNRGWIEDPNDHLRFSIVETKLSAKFQYTFRL